MSSTGVLQIRADSKLISQARNKADALGFSSIQEVVRVFLTNLVNDKVETKVVAKAEKERFPAEYIKFGPKAKKRWDVILRDADAGENMYEFDDPEEALNYLLSEER